MPASKVAPRSEEQLTSRSPSKEAVAPTAVEETSMNHQPIRPVTRAVTTALVAAGMMAATMPAAQAGDGDDRKGTTRVAVAPAVVSKLDRLGLEAAPTKGATAVPFEGTVA